VLLQRTAIGGALRLILVVLLLCLVLYLPDYCLSVDTDGSIE
jgi:hypothetical protein